jgi:hypothetical protein
VQTAIKASWGDVSNVFGSVDPNQVIQRTMTVAGILYAGGGGRKIYAGPPNDGGVHSPTATVQAIIELQIIGSGSMTGEIDFFYVDLGVPNLYVYENPTGILTAQGQWREGQRG